MTATKTVPLMPGCVGICGRRPSSPPAHFKMSRWPSSPGGGLQNRAGERNSHTGLQSSLFELRLGEPFLRAFRWPSRRSLRTATKGCKHCSDAAVS